MSVWFALAWPSSLRRIVARFSVAALIWLLSDFAGVLPTFAQSKKSSTSAVTCGTCHVGVATSYSHAPMRHAMESPGANPALETHPNLSVQMGQYFYTVQTKDGKSTYTVSDGKDSLTLPIRWIFGQHSQTWVLEKDGHLYESLVSYFPRDNGLATTPGDQKITPHNLIEAMGRRLQPWETRSCFNCHATDAVAGDQLTLDKLRPGLDCERCHVGAQQHMADAENDNFKTLPKSLKRMDSESISNFCGECHRSWDAVIRNHWHGPAFVRFQPYRLQNSKCFSGNDPRISCVACHNPHQPANRNDVSYDSKCLACHSAAKASHASTARVCTVSKNNCVSCHMPKVELPGGHTSFTDHQIRVVKPGEAYPN